MVVRAQPKVGELFGRLMLLRRSVPGRLHSFDPQSAEAKECFNLKRALTDRFLVQTSAMWQSVANATPNEIEMLARTRLGEFIDLANELGPAYYGPFLDLVAEIVDAFELKVIKMDPSLEPRATTRNHMNLVAQYAREIAKHPKVTAEYDVDWHNLELAAVAHAMTGAI
ncbi:MAG: hypothetical protein ABIE84_06980 [bacterium]